MFSTKNIYQTTCYKRQGNELMNAENCTVTLQYEHPENGLNWKIVTLSGQVHHYRNLGIGIERWNDPTQHQKSLSLET